VKPALLEARIHPPLVYVDGSEHGVFAPNSRFRSAIVPGPAKSARSKPKHPVKSTPAEAPVEPAQPTAPLTTAGQIVYELKHPFRDGTTHILFTPKDFIARLAALVPRPRANLTRYHGVFAPNSPLRKSIVPGSPKRARRRPKDSRKTTPLESSDNQAQPTAPLTWAQRLKRVFEIG
jgi:hypothetical protein